MKAKLLTLLIVLFSANTFACDTTQIRLDSSYAGPGPSNGFEINFACLDSSINLYFLDPIQISSVQANGENFSILTPNLDTILATSAIANTLQLGLDSTLLIQIKLPKPLFTNGKYQLLINPSAQGVPIKNVCGVPWLSDTIQVDVSSCFKAHLHFQSITLLNPNKLQLNWKADTSTFPTYLFKAYNIYRKTPLDNSFIKIGNSLAVLDTNYTDGNIPQNFIGFAEYYIALQLDSKEVITTDTLSYYLVLNQPEHEKYVRWVYNHRQDLFSIESLRDFKLEIIDINGRTIFKKQMNSGDHKIDLTLFKKGIYLVVVDQKYIRKLVVQ